MDLDTSAELMRPLTGLCRNPLATRSSPSQPLPVPLESMLVSQPVFCMLHCKVCSKLHGAVHFMMLDTKVTQKMLQEAAVHAMCRCRMWGGGGGEGRGREGVERASPV